MSLDVRLTIPDKLFSSLSNHLLQHASTTGLEEAALLFAHPVVTDTFLGLIVARWIAIPPEAFHIQREDQFAIDSAFLVQHMKTARARGESLLLAHSHPGDPDIPLFSLADVQGEGELLAFLAHRLPARPHGVLVVSPGGAQAAIYNADRVRHVASVRVVGRRTTIISRRPTSSPDPLRARQELLWGAHGQGVLRHARIGIIGAGGTGSLVAQQLIHLGVGTLVVIDPETVAASNLARIPGARRTDIDHTLKVDIVARTAARVDPSIQVQVIPEDVCQSKVLRELLGLDLLFLCTHGHYSRAVINALSVQYALPLVDMGFRIEMNQAYTRIASAEGEIRVIVPDGYCLQCIGVLNAERIRQEKAHPEERLAHPEYYADLDVPDPSVMTVNMVISGQAVTLGLDMLVPTLRTVAVTDSIRYHALKGLLSYERKPLAVDCPICGLDGVRLFGDDHPLPL